MIEPEVPHYYTEPVEIEIGGWVVSELEQGTDVIISEFWYPTLAAAQAAFAQLTGGA